MEHRIDVSYNVRSARHLGHERLNRILQNSLQSNDCLKVMGRFCFSFLPEDFNPEQQAVPIFSQRVGSMFYRELDSQQRKYFIYVLKPKF